MNIKFYAEMSQLFINELVNGQVEVKVICMVSNTTSIADKRFLCRCNFDSHEIAVFEYLRKQMNPVHCVWDKASGDLSDYTNL